MGAFFYSKAFKKKAMSHDFSIRVNRPISNQDRKCDLYVTRIIIVPGLRFEYSTRH